MKRNLRLQWLLDHLQTKGPISLADLPATRAYVEATKVPYDLNPNGELFQCPYMVRDLRMLEKQGKCESRVKATGLKRGQAAWVREFYLPQAE